MAPKVAHAYKPPSQTISKSRAAKSAFLTILSIMALLQLGYHAYWSYKVFMYDYYGSFLNNAIFGIGSLVANGGISFRVLSFLNEKLIDDGIDADHKKYI